MTDSRQASCQPYDAGTSSVTYEHYLIYLTQLKGSMKEPNISIHIFFRPSLKGVLFPMFCLLGGRGVSDFSVLKYY